MWKSMDANPLRQRSLHEAIVPYNAHSTKRVQERAFMAEKPILFVLTGLPFAGKTRRGRHIVSITLLDDRICGIMPAELKICIHNYNAIGNR